MGLTISVGVLADLLTNDPDGAAWFQSELSAANQLLEAEGIPTHQEPRQLPPLVYRAEVDSIPYSFLHYLRRAYAHRRVDPAWHAVPLDDSVDPTADPVLQEETAMMTSHLLCHSDAEGFYLPVDFDEPVFEAIGGSVQGGIVGSAQRLMDELCTVAASIDIMLSADRTLPDAEAARINMLVAAGTGLHRELASWLLLFEAARLSLAYRTAIVFG